jgi:hypothetical protein
MAYHDWPDGRTHSIPYAQHLRNARKGAPANPAAGLRDKQTATSSKPSSAKGDLDDRVKRDPKLLARALRDPGLRAKLDDRYLTAAQRASRKRNDFLRQLGDVGTPLTGDAMVNAARQITDDDYRPLLDDNTQQSTAANISGGLQQGVAKKNYGSLDSLLGSVGNAQNNANNQSILTAAQRGTASQQGIAAMDAAAQQRMAADAAVRGPGLEGDQPAQLAARTAGEQMLAANEAQRATDAASQFGGAQAAFLKGLRGAAAQQGVEQSANINNQTGALVSKLAGDRAQLQGSKAGDYTKTLLNLRQQQQDNAFTAAGLGLDQAKLDAAGQPSASDLKTKADLAFFKKHGYYPQTGPTKKAGPKVITSGPLAGHTQAWVAAHPKDSQALVNKYERTHSGKKGTGKDKDASNADVSKATTSIDAAVNAVQKALGGAHGSRSQQANTLLSGRPEQAHTESQKDKKSGVTKSGKVIDQSGIEPTDSLYASIALDIVHDGHVSKRNAQRLHARGLTVEDLGLPSATAYAKKQAAADKKDKSRWGPN